MYHLQTNNSLLRMTGGKNAHLPVHFLYHSQDLKQYDLDKRQSEPEKKNINAVKQTGM